jgi:hypothetical protein
VIFTLSGLEAGHGLAQSEALNGGSKRSTVVNVIALHAGR